MAYIQRWNRWRSWNRWNTAWQSQGDILLSKLIFLALEIVFEKLEWEKKGINIDGVHLNHLRFVVVDDIVLLSTDIQELNMKSEINMMSYRNYYITIYNVVIENVDHYTIYLGYKIKFGRKSYSNILSLISYNSSILVHHLHYSNQTIFKIRKHHLFKLIKFQNYKCVYLTFQYIILGTPMYLNSSTPRVLAPPLQMDIFVHVSGSMFLAFKISTIYYTIGITRTQIFICVYE